MNSVILIPAYQPDKKLIELMNELLTLNPAQIFILVDDGSTTEEAKHVFDVLSTYPSITLLKHATNQGKGKALKTGFAYFLEKFPESSGVVTADADGQHQAVDIMKIAQELDGSKKLVLGIRVFDQSVPWRSRFGNEMTRKIFGWFSGKTIQDTQTGLRGLSKDVLLTLLNIEENDYAFEMNVLMLAVKENWKIKEVPIKTVYIEQNRSSHFNPLKDSLKIYFVFIRYSILSLLSACIDFLLFFLFFHLSQSVVFGTALARILSGTFNFIYCKKLIFKSNAKALREAIHYIGLAIISIVLSSLLVSVFFYHIKFNIFFSKLLADSLIFLCNFMIQRVFIFGYSKDT